VSRLERQEVFAIVAGVFALATRIPTLGLPLLEWHGWRQTWTAYTALLFHEDGFDLFHPRLPIFGPPYEVPMEFPAVQAVAALLMNGGVGADLAMRLTHLALFFLSAGLLYGLLKRVASPAVALAGLVFFLFVPTNILWSRASLTEYGATAGALAYLWAGIAWRDTRRPALFAVALVAGTLGMLVKPTTPIFWTLPLLLWRTPDEEAVGLAQWIRARLDPALVALCVVPTAVAYGWTMWADGIKGAQEAAAFMTSTATREFYYASLAERFDPVIWKRTWSWISGYVVGVGMLPVFAVGLFAAWRSRRPAFYGGLLLAAITPFAIFYGGYYKHDYYWAALTPEVAAFVGLGAAWLIERARSVPRRAVVTAALVVAAVASLQSSREYWSRAYPPLNDFEGVLPRARELAAQSRPDDRVLVVGRAYNPDLAYYARRDTLMLTVENQTDHLLRRVATERYGVLFSWDPTNDPIWVARYWAWNGVVGPRTYTLGASASELRGAPIMSTDDLIAFERAAVQTPGSLITAPLTIPCDLASRLVPAGARGTWLRIRPDTGARLSPSALYAPVAARQVLVLAPSVTFGERATWLSCSGTAAIVIEAIYDAPPPG
jgi:4-amino-4-deoxy-L-arabinose transferase-like glycosyltransferase